MFYKHITLNILHLYNKYLIRTITFNFMGLNFMMKTYIQRDYILQNCQNTDLR